MGLTGQYDMRSHRARSTTQAIIAGAFTVTFVLGALALALNDRWSAFADDPPPNDASFELDVNPTQDGIQTTRTVALGASFNVVVLTNTTDALPWEGYQVTLNYDDVTLEPVAPASTWAAAPVEGTSGGNVFVFTTGATCTPATQAASVFGEDEIGLANYAMTCTETTSGTTHTGEGALIQFAFTCAANGTADFTISAIADTFLLDNQFNQFNNHVHNGQVTCGTAPTDTPVAPTNTPAPPTNTPPAATNTPTSTPTRTNTPVPPTNTPTNTPTRTNTPVPPTNTPTNTPTRTNTPVPPTNTPHEHADANEHAGTANQYAHEHADAHEHPGAADQHPHEHGNQHADANEHAGTANQYAH